MGHVSLYQHCSHPATGEYQVMRLDGARASDFFKVESEAIGISIKLGPDGVMQSASRMVKPEAHHLLDSI